ncbi:hypothetical protein BDE36_1157 [Arcticibacter tournemirensis]|nr:hypothetical protein BDE36_1157 [Arcticibacter tournemirensis]
MTSVIILITVTYIWLYEELMHAWPDPEEEEEF